MYIFFCFFCFNTVGCLNSRFSNLLFYSMFALEMTSYAPTISLRTKTLRMIGQILLALQYATYLILFSLSEYHSQKCSWTSGRSNGRQEPLEAHKSQHAFACLNFPFSVGLSAFHFEGMSFINNVLC